MTSGYTNSCSYEVSSRQTFCLIFRPIEQEISPLEGPQGISLIWPSNLVFDPRWPKFSLIQDFIKTNTLTFKSNEQKMWPLECPHNISFIWPSFWTRWPKFQLIWEFLKTNILTIFQANWARNVASRVLISWIWPSDLVFYLRWPEFELIRDFIKIQNFAKTNILPNLQVNWARNVASRAPTIYLFNLT